MATDNRGAARRGVTAFFDDRAAAQQAVDDLVAAGVARDRLTLVEGGPEPVASDPVPSPDKGIWQTVKDLFMADEDRHAYGEGLRRGGFLLSVMTAGDEARVVEILDREGAVDMDARQGAWESEGWDPARASADFRALSGADARAAIEPVGAVGPAFGTGEARAAPGATPAPAAMPDADVRAAVEPVGAVGPAFGTGEAGTPRPGRRTVTRDADAEGLRLRTYVESPEAGGGSR